MSQNALLPSSSALTRICWSCQWQLLRISTICQPRLLHQTAIQYKGGKLTQKSSERRSVKPSTKPRRPSQSRVPARMKLSGSVAKGPLREPYAKGDRKKKPQPTIERFSGMNKTSFTPNPAERHARERFLASKREHLRVDKDKPTRPPERQFKQMKQIAKLDTVSLKERFAAAEAVKLHEDFKSFDLLPQINEAVIKDALGDIETVEPTPVQRLAIPSLMERFDKSKLVTGDKFMSYLIAAETGSGKTLAYLLPILNSIKRNEIRERREEEENKAAELQDKKEKGAIFDLEPELNIRDTKTGKPRCVILLPTIELVEQVGRTLKSLSHVIKFRSEVIHRDVPGHIIRSRMFARPLEIVVSTPALLESILKSEPNLLELTTHLVADEADSLFDQSFSPITSSIISNANNLEKLILCSATIPKSLDTYLARKYPNINRLVTPNLHAIPRRVQLSVVEVDKPPYRGKKDLACADIIQNLAKEATDPGFKKRVIVFVNERETTAELTEYLREKGFDVIDVHRDTKTRSSLATFAGPREPVPEDVKNYRQNMQVLVTTDIMSRGIDTRTLKNVVLYDVPFTSIDFIHRLGRTGRMGRRGKAFILVDKDSNKEWVKDIKKSMFMGKSLL